MELVWFFFFSHSVAIATGKNRQLQPLSLNSYGTAVFRGFLLNLDLCARLQPEIEKRGYVMAKNSRTADYFVHVRYPFDPLGSQASFEKAEPTVPFLRSHETGRERAELEYKTAIANMVREPK